MPRYRIAWLEGDGVGKDVMEATRIVLDALALDAEYPKGDIGWEFWCREGNPLPDRTLDLLKTTDCALFGAITSKPTAEAEQDLIPELQGQGLVYSSSIVRLRQKFDLHTNLRPCKAYPGNPLNVREGIDLVVFRENTEGLYAGVEFHPVADDLRQSLVAHCDRMARFDNVAGEDLAISCRVFTKAACRNIAREAFSYAATHGYGTVTVVEKPNVLRETSGMMVRMAREVAADYPGIDLWEANIDAMCMWLLKNPRDYGVLVSTNMFGDIVSDLCAQLVGGLGFAASGNIGDDYAVFEPTHGSAPKYAGLYKVNPIAMMLTARLMLDWLGEENAAQRLESAIAEVIREGRVRTYDMGGKSSSLEVAEEVARKL